ncbi:MAG: YcxB family protein [Sphingomonas sp.]|nr:YcxB family protein [Sphingomonas sp.]
MSIAISYASTRAEVWQYYWRLWRARLWKTHLLVFMAVGILTYLMLPIEARSGLSAMGKVGLAGSSPLIFLILYPMLRFKPQVREVKLDQKGITTSIGRRHGDIPWSDVAAVDADESSLVIRCSNLNALIVPARAFANPEKRAEFEAFVRAHAKVNGS